MLPPRTDLELQALAEVLAGARRIHCHSYRQDEIFMLCQFAQEHGIRIGTFQHVLEGYKVADAIAQNAVGASSFSDWWAFKLEAMSRSGFADRYQAFNAGFERTLVGVFGTRSDVGIVVEYLYDGRGDDAFDTLFERDVALGTRWSFNDPADTQALAGFIVDHHTHAVLSFRHD